MEKFTDGIYYDAEFVMDGAYFTIYAETGATEEDINKCKKYLHEQRDVVGKINVIHSRD